MITRLFLSVLLLYVFVLPVFSDEIPEAPIPAVFVNDYAEVLTLEQQKSLENRLDEFSSTTSNQLVVVTVSDLAGYSPGEYARKLGNKWGVGQKNKDNGIVLLVKPKYAHEKGQVFISVGYGLESAIPDAKAKGIIDNILIPHFKKNEMHEGISEAVNALIALTEGKNIAGLNPFRVPVPEESLLITMLILFLLLPFIFIGYIRRRKLSPEYQAYSFEGEYCAVNILSQIASLEKLFGKKFPKLTSSVKKYDSLSRKKLTKYAQPIDRKLFCIMLNGRPRFKVFREFIDPGFYLLLLILLSANLYFSLIVFEYGGIAGAILSFLICLFLIYALISFLISFMEIYLFILRKSHMKVGKLPLTIFAVNALLRRNIRRRYDPRSGTYMYYPAVMLVSSGSSYGGYGGYSGGGGGGFGGGGFGGGGAGGSW